jgi:hypothetical protein
MRKFVVIVFIGVLLSALPGIAQNRTKSNSDKIVLVFKDGHRQSFNLADLASIEFAGPAIADSGSTPPGAPPRGHFIGKWVVGDGSGGTFFITLNEDGSAWRTLHRSHGRWAYVNGEARVTWDDGALDAIWRVGGEDKKSAYRAGKSFTDQPDNVTDAHNMSPRPI